MKHLQSINEYTRTVGFRYSEPSIRFNAIASCKGELSEEQFKELMSYIEVKFENLKISEENKEVDFDEITIDTNLSIEFDFFVYNENEVPQITEDIQNGLNREFDVQTYEFLYKLSPKLKK